MPHPRSAGVADMPLVLIVDDNEKNLKLARDVLRAAGLGTLEAANGAEGIALAGEHLPDVILMDLRLPDMDGTDAAQRLGERGANGIDPGRRVELAATRGRRRLARSGRVRRLARKADQRRRVPGPGAPLLHEQRRVTPVAARRRKHRASTPSNRRWARLARAGAPSNVGRVDTGRIHTGM